MTMPTRSGGFPGLGGPGGSRTGMNLPLAAAALRRRRRVRPVGAGQPRGLALGRRGLQPGHLMQQGAPRPDFTPPGQVPRQGTPTPGMPPPRTNGLGPPQMPAPGVRQGTAGQGIGAAQNALPVLAQFLRRLGGPSRGLPFQRPR